MCHNIECRCNENSLYNKVKRIDMTKLFSLADRGGGRIYDFLNVQTTKFHHATLAIHYKHNNFITQRAKQC